MKAAVYYENGGPEVLRYEDVPDPVCGPDQVLIEVQAVSIEGGDLLYRWGAPPPTKPYIVGYQAAGIVREVGGRDLGLEVGMRVATVGANGSHAQLRVVSPRTAYRVPEGLSIPAANLFFGSMAPARVLEIRGVFRRARACPMEPKPCVIVRSLRLGAALV